MLVPSQKCGALNFSFSKKWDILGPFQVGTRGERAIVKATDVCTEAQ